MVALTRRLAAGIPRLASPSARGHRRAVLLVMASVLLLSGCMLSPLFQAPAALMTGFAVLLGLAACSGGGGGGGGDTPSNETPPPATITPWPAVVSLNALLENPAFGRLFVADPPAPGNGNTHEYAGDALAIGPSLKGDGFDTLVIGAPYSYDMAPNGEGASSYGGVGRAYVVFGTDDLTALGGSSCAIVQLAMLPSANGFRITGYDYLGFGYAGRSVAIAGDLRNDGKAAVLVGEPYAEDNSSHRIGKVWAVFAPSSGDVVLDGLTGTNGFVVANGFNNEQGFPSSAYPVNYLGYSVATLDLNGDGFTDVIGGAPRTQGFSVCPAPNIVYSFSSTLFCGTGAYSGASAVSTVNAYFNPGAQFVFGSAAVGEGGAQPIYNAAPSFTTAPDAEGALALAKGRVNGDGIDDLIVGAPNFYYNLGTDSYGAVYVVFGQPVGAEPGIAGSPAALDGPRGFTIVNSQEFTYELGFRVASADVNGDGIDDIIMSDLFYNYVSPTQNGYYGRVWVVFGQEGTPSWGSQLNLANLTPGQGFSITLPKSTYVDSLTVAKVNGDGFKDVLIGSPSAELVQSYYYSGGEMQPGMRYKGYSNGAVFVVFGGSSLSRLATSELNGTNGFTVLGPDFAKIGYALAAGDVNHDGHDDVAVGAPEDRSVDSESNFIAPGGGTYLVFGTQPTETLPSHALAEDAYIGRGNFHSLSGPPPVLAGAGGQPAPLGKSEQRPWK